MATIDVHQSDLTSGGTVSGGAGTDTLRALDTQLNLTSTTLSSIEIIRTALSTATVFTVDAADLASGGSVIGGAGSDTLRVADTVVDLRSTTLSSIEIVKTTATVDSTFLLDAADLAANGSVFGSAGSDTLTVAGTAFDLSATKLSSVETLAADSSTDTTFTVKAGHFAGAQVQSVVGGAGNDMLAIKDSSLDLTSTTLSGIETIQAATTLATTFTLDQADVASVDFVVGGSNVDTLAINGPALDLTSTWVSSVEILKAATSSDTTFTVDVNDLASVGSVIGGAGSDTLAVASTLIDLASTTLTSVETIAAGTTAATTFSMNYGHLAGFTIAGGAGVDTLSVTGAGNFNDINLTSTTLSGVEVLKVESIGAFTTLTLDAANTASLQSIESAQEGLWIKAAEASLDLGDVTLKNVIVVQANVLDTTFTLNQENLNSLQYLIGSDGNDTLKVFDPEFHITGDTLIRKIETLENASTTGMTFTMRGEAEGLTIIGASGAADSFDFLVDYSQDLTSVDTLVHSMATIANFEADEKIDLTHTLGGSGGYRAIGASTQAAIDGAADVKEALTIAAQAYDGQANGPIITSFAYGGDTYVLSDASGKSGFSNLDSVVRLTGSHTLSAANFVGGDANPTVYLSVSNGPDALPSITPIDIATVGTITGGAGVDTLHGGSRLDLSSTVLNSVERIEIEAPFPYDGELVVNQADLAAGGSVIGAANALDTLTTADAKLDLRSTSLSSIEILAAGRSTATTFTVDADDLAAGGYVIGSSGNDTLAAAGTSLDLTSTDLISVETLKSLQSTDTTFTVDGVDTESLKTIRGSSGTDTLVVASDTIDLSSTALSSVEIIATTTTDDASFRLNQADLAAGGSILGGGGYDQVIAADAQLNLTSTTLSGIEQLVAGRSTATTFTVDAADLAAGGYVVGGAGNDTLTVRDTAVDLTSTTLSSVETLKAGLTSATLFTLDADDAPPLKSIVGSAEYDTLAMVGTALDLSTIALSSVEVLSLAMATENALITVNQADLAAGGYVIGGYIGTDTLTTADAQLNLTSTTLSSVEVLAAGRSTATVFTVDAADLVADGSIISGSVVGGAGNDTLVVVDTAVDLTSTTLSSVEIVRAGLSSATLFTLDADDAAPLKSIAGGAGVDTLVIGSTAIDLRSTALSSVEILATSASDPTTFIVNQADLAAGGYVIGGAGYDQLITADAQLNLTSTTLSGVEQLVAGRSTATTFTVDTDDLVAGGYVVGGAGNDTLAVASATVDLTSTTLSSVEFIKTTVSDGTVFTLDGSQIVSPISPLKGVTGGAGYDTLVVTGDTVDLRSMTLSNVEVIAANASVATTFWLNQADLASGGYLIGGVDINTLAAADAQLNLTSTTLSGIEILAAGRSTATVFTVDAADLIADGSVIGGAGNDTLTVVDAAVDLTSTTLASVETLKTGVSTGALFTVDSADLASLKTITGGAGADQLDATGASVDLRSTALSSIETIATTNATGTTFFVNQADLAAGGSVIGGAGSDTLKTADTRLDLSNTTLTSIETVAAGGATGVTFTLDADGEGLSITGAGGTGADKFKFVAGYAQDQTSAASLQATVATITNFQEAVSSEVIDTSVLTLNGTASYRAIGAAVQTAIGVASDLKAAAILAAQAFDGGVNSVVTSFAYAGDTYVLVDNHGTSGLDAGDAVIKLSGVHSLTANDFVA